MKQKKQENKKQPAIIAGILAVLIVLAGGITVWHTLKKAAFVSPKVSLSLPENAVATGEGSYMVPTSISGQMKFVSPKLGVSFLISGTPSITEMGDKIIFDPHSGVSTFLQIFQKNPQESLKTAVEGTLLKGYSSTDCFFITGNPHDRFMGGYHGKLETGMIDFPFSNEYGSGGTKRSFEAYSKCPDGYTHTDIETKRYFGYDPKYPNKYAYIRIDGSTPGSGSYYAPRYQLGWDETIQFIK